MGESYTPPEICERTYSFSVRILKLVRAMPRDLAGSVVARQLARCGTSVGANIEEAQGAYSKADFVHRMNIARKEAREAFYWLRLIRDVELAPAGRLGELIQEAEELVRILVAIVKKSKENG